VQEYPVHSRVDDLWVLSGDVLSPGLKSLPASLVCAPATHQIWTNGYCAHHRLRAYARWLHTCTLKVVWIKLSAGCLSYDHSFQPFAYKAQNIMTIINQKFRSSDLLFRFDETKVSLKKQIWWRRQLFRPWQKQTVRDDYARLFNQLLLSKCLSFVFLHSHLKGLS